jgi:hypothetical protein
MDAIKRPIDVLPRAIADLQTRTGEVALSSAANITLTRPANALPASRVVIEVNRSVAGTLLNGIEYLTGYPYGCVEQTMSRALPNAVVARAFKQLGMSNAQTSYDLPQAGGIQPRQRNRGSGTSPNRQQPGCV